MQQEKTFLSTGVKHMLLAIFCFGLVNVMVKSLHNIPSLEIVWFRGIFMALFSLAILKRNNVNIWGNNKKVLLLRGLFGTFGVCLFFISLKRMDLSSAQVIHYTAPIFTTLIASLFLKEKVKYLQWLFFLLSFVGVLVVKGFGDISTTDFIIGITSAFFSGCAYASIRRLKGTENPTVIIFYFALVALPLMSLYFAIFPENWVNPKGVQWSYLIGIGTFTQIAQYFMTKAYQGEVANRISGVSYSGIVFAIFFGIVFFNE
jgi:drug/metabolite transporter (DMT)-like permease